MRNTTFEGDISLRLFTLHDNKLSCKEGHIRYQKMICQIWIDSLESLLVGLGRVFNLSRMIPDTRMMTREATAAIVHFRIGSLHLSVAVAH